MEQICQHQEVGVFWGHLTVKSALLAPNSEINHDTLQLKALHSYQEFLHTPPNHHCFHIFSNNPET